jgi:TP901 family phage tail tape measure protein
MGTGAEEIRQQMILDAQAVLTELQRVDDAFNKFGSQLAGMGSKFDSFNQSAAKTISALQQITTEATNAFNALSKVGQAPAVAGGAGGAGGATGGGAAGAEAREVAKIMAETRTPQEQYAERMTRLSELAQKGAIDQQTFGRAVAQAGSQVSSAADPLRNLTITWETLARVVMTQFIVRALSQVRDAFSESYEASLKFSKQIGELRAVDSSRSFAEIAAQVRSMSDAFNQPLSNVAEATYQTLSHQFVSTADQLNILTAANELSKVSTQSLEGAVTLLSGALNAYGESSDMAGLRAAQFDLTINLAHLRMADLATALGRTQTLAHAMGISMEELDAALISMSIGGLKASEAATQLRSMMNALLKPSEGMKAALDEIGASSGEAAVAAYGFRGAFEAVAATTDRTIGSLSKLIPNIRGLPGALRLLNEGAQQYEEGLKKLAAVDMETLHKKVQDFISTDAEKLTAELNKISNFFKVEFGADLVKSMAGVLAMFGGSGGLVSMLRALTGSLPMLVAGFGGLIAVLVAIKLEAMAAASSIGGLRVGFLALIGVPMAQAAGKALGEIWRQNMIAESQAITETADATIRMKDRKSVV